MIVELGFIYYLQNPLTDEIFYVGSTQISLKNRIRTHYQHLREFERGLRKTNRRYEYLLKIKPIKATIHLLEIVHNSDLYEREVYYINLFRQLNPNLTNMTDGGFDGRTTKYFTEQEIEEYSKKQSLIAKGKKKPEGFALRLSAQRMGLGNPAAKKMERPIVCFLNGNPEQLFYYNFEINNYFGCKDAGGNVQRALKQKHYRPHKRDWFFLDEISKKNQDILTKKYIKNLSL